ncbi:hypothetical protein [Streptomyces sp. NPDC126503]|uniref:hypothetical protein n=1 Tax=Streptomyces sp. NPDC126503 TaxID=3155315 RepID=UPI003323AB98
MGNTRVTAVAGAMAAALLAAGCGPGGSSTGAAPSSRAPAASVFATPASTTGPFGQRAVYDEIAAVATAAKLPGFEIPQFDDSSPSRSATAPATEKERVVRRAMACSAIWGSLPSPVDLVGDGFDKAVADFRWRGWTVGEPEEETRDDGATVQRVILTNRGWTMVAGRHVLGEDVPVETLLFLAREDVCMEQFTDRELDLLGW